MKNLIIPFNQFIGEHVDRFQPRIGEGHAKFEPTGDYFKVGKLIIKQPFKIIPVPYPPGENDPSYANYGIEPYSSDWDEEAADTLYLDWIKEVAREHGISSIYFPDEDKTVEV